MYPRVSGPLTDGAIAGAQHHVEVVTPQDRIISSKGTSKKETRGPVVAALGKVCDGKPKASPAEVPLSFVLEEECPEINQGKEAVTH